MGIDAVLEHEDRRAVAEVGDPHNILSRLLPIGDASFQHVSYIDPYGYTTFNHMQKVTLIEEWQRLYPRCKTIEERGHLARVEQLAQQLNHHLYLRFIGD